MKNRSDEYQNTKYPVELSMKVDDLEVQARITTWKRFLVVVTLDSPCKGMSLARTMWHSIPFQRLSNYNEASLI